MKRIILFLLLPAMLGACKKDNNGTPAPKTALLSRTLTDGHTRERAYYSSDNKLTKYEVYSDKSPYELAYYIVISYDAQGNYSQLTSYHEPGNVATDRRVVQTTDNGKIQSAALYDLQSATPNVAYATATWTYNVQGQLIKTEVKNKIGVLYIRTNYSYFADGSVKQVEDYAEESNQLYLTHRQSFSVPGTYYPKGLEVLKPLEGPQFTGTFFNETIQDTYYDQAGTITNSRSYQMSAREYNNEDSTLTRQTITTKYIKPAQADKLENKQYEYIKQ